MKTAGIYSAFNFEECDLEQPIFEKAGVAMRVSKTEEEYKAMLPEIDGLIVSYAPVTAEDIARMDKCKVIVRQGMGVDNINVDAATEKGIIVCNIPAYNIHEVAEHTLASIMMLLRNIPFYDLEIRCNKNWSWKALPIMRRFCEISIGIIGFGKIGQLLAAKSKPHFGRILAYDPFMNNEKAAELGVEVMTLDELLAESDVISIHVPLSDKTRNIINADSFKKLKKGAYVVNAARGGLMDENALLEAIDRGDVAGAALDVTEDAEWPVLSKPIYNHMRVINTPHTAWYTQQALEESRTTAAVQIVDVFEGRRPVGRLN